MGLIELVNQLVTEHGSSIIQRDNLALLRDEAASEARKMAEITAERDALKTECDGLKIEVEALRVQVAALTNTRNFRNYRGLLWLPLASGGYEDAPYCPKCETVMYPDPPAEIMRPMNWVCSSCNFTAAYCKPPED